MQTKPASLAFPWPQPLQLRGPAVRTVVHDPVWMASLRRTIDTWRKGCHSVLPMAKFANLDELSTAVCNLQLLDIIEVSPGELSTVADWISARRKKNAVVAVLCRQTLRAAENRHAAAQLLGEAGAIDVFASTQQLPRLAEVLTWLEDRSPAAADPLGELPLPCWAPPWQQPR